MNRREFLGRLGGMGLAALVGGSQIAPRATHTVNLVMNVKYPENIVRLARMANIPISTLTKMKASQVAELEKVLGLVK